MTESCYLTHMIYSEPRPRALWLAPVEDDANCFPPPDIKYNWSAAEDVRVVGSLPPSSSNNTKKR